MKSVLRILFVVLLTIPPVANAQRIPINANLVPSQMYDKAMTMLSKGYTEKGFGYLKMAAGKHYIPALKYLGQCYLEGKYVEQNKQQAGRIFEIASKLGDSESASILASLQASGEYSPTNTSASGHVGQQIVQVVNNFNVISSGQSGNENHKTKVEDQPSDVDINIPMGEGRSDNTFVVIISNENYQEEVKVDYAIRDGKTFLDYCTKTLSIPKENIHFRKDATYNNIRSELSWLEQLAQSYNGKEKILFYYAGHGFPDESSRTAYLLPVDGKGNNVSTGYSLNELYNTLGSLPSENVIVFLDACFSGSQRGDGMLAAARGIAIKAKPNVPKGNMVVFSAAKDDETAYPYKEKRHGLFTYYLLQELQKTNGECTLGELADYITSNVTRKSIVANGKSQTPTVVPSELERDSWKNIKIK